MSHGMTEYEMAQEKTAASAALVFGLYVLGWLLGLFVTIVVIVMMILAAVWLVKAAIVVAKVLLVVGLIGTAVGLVVWSISRIFRS